MKLIISVAVVLSCIGATASAAQVVLNERANPQTAIIRLGDVALVTAADSLLARQLAQTPLMPAASPGNAHYLRATELHDLLVARGVDTRDIQFSGAEIIVIGDPDSPASESEQLPSVHHGPATPEQLTAAIVDYLRHQTGHDLWNVQVEADEKVMAAFGQAGGAVVSGGKAPWTGRQRFAIAGALGAPPVLAHARVDRMEMAVVVTRPIERGQLIRRTDIELRAHLGAVPKQAMFAVESAVGNEALQGLRAGSLLLTNQVRSPLVVRRGDRVSVRVRAAGVSIRTFAIAQQDGSVGELVSVQSAEGKERYTAVVRGLRELEIMAAGTSAVDVASAAPREVR